MLDPRKDEKLFPLRALLAPTWLGALVLLAVNDHFLKGSGLLPGAVTGKLSDFAGLFAAPVLMAALLAVRSRRGLALCHVAVGLVFSAIQLSADAAAGWSAVMGMLGFPWSITRDPTDLLALPALFASWQLLVPHMTGARSVRSNLRRSAEWGTAGAGLVCCMATSPVEGPLGPETFAPFDAAVYLNNASDEDITVRLRELRDDVEIDCFEISKDPGVLPDAAFGDTLTWNMPAWTNIPAHSALGGQECYAVLVDGDGLSPALLFWLDGQPPVGFVEGQTFDDGSHQSGGVVIEFDADGVHQGYRSTGIDVVFDRELTAPEYAPGCEPQSDADRVDWSEPVPTGKRYLEAFEIGPDGCVALDLSDEAQAGSGETDRWYVCIPAELWGPKAGTWIEISQLGSIGNESVSIELLGDDMLPLQSDKVRMVLSRGVMPPDLGGLQTVVREFSACDMAVDEACGTVSRAGYVQAWGTGGSHDIAAGDPVVTIDVDESTTVELAVMFAEQRYVLDAACAEGSDQLGPDVEMVAVIRED